jgi:hypothetical protein
MADPLMARAYQKLRKRRKIEGFEIQGNDVAGIGNSTGPAGQT